jgi:hypothetical protein
MEDGLSLLQIEIFLKNVTSGLSRRKEASPSELLTYLALRAILNGVPIVRRFTSHVLLP